MTRSNSGLIHKLLKLMIGLLLILYILTLFKIICLKYMSLSDLSSRFSSDLAFRPVNLIPTVTIYKYYLAEQMSWLRRIGNVLGNVYLFVPLGLLLPAISKKARKLWVILLISFFLSALFEASQYILASGSCDIDDVILNTLGGILGILLYRIICLISKKESCQLILALGLFSVLIIAGYFVASKEFNLDLGMKKFSNTDIQAGEIQKTISAADSSIIIPTGKRNLMGLLEEMRGDTISINKYRIKRNPKNKSQITMVMPRQGNMQSVFEYYLKENTYILRKDVEQYCTTKFDIKYSLSVKDSISLARDIEIWTSPDDSTKIDTLCFWVVHKH